MPPPHRIAGRDSTLRAVSPGGRFSLTLDGRSWLLWDLTAGHPIRTGQLHKMTAGWETLTLAEDGRSLSVRMADGGTAEIDLIAGVWGGEQQLVVPDAAAGHGLAIRNRHRTVGGAVVGRAVVPLLRLTACVGSVVAAAGGWFPSGLALAVLVLLAGRSARRVRIHLSMSEPGVSRA